MADSKLLARFAPVIDAMLEDEGVELFVSHFGVPVASIKDKAGIAYPLTGVQWSITEDQMDHIVSGIRKATTTGEGTHVHDGKTFRFRLEDDVIVLRYLPNKEGL